MDLHWLKLQDGALRPLHPRTNYSSLHETSHHVTTQRAKPCITILYLFQLLNKIFLYKSNATFIVTVSEDIDHIRKGGGPRVVVSTAALHARVRFPVSAVWKRQKMFLPHLRVKVSIVGSLRDREVACSASDRQGSNFESCVWRTVSSQSSHHPQEVLLAQFSLYVHKGGLKPDSFKKNSTSEMFLTLCHCMYLDRWTCAGTEYG